MGNNDVEKEFSLEAPCLFCGYNGPGYWQSGTHDDYCLFRYIGGEVKREEALRAIVSKIDQYHKNYHEGEVLELTRQLKRKPSVGTALAIMSWELGDAVKSYKHGIWYPDLGNIYKAEMKAALASLLFQTLVVAKLKGWTIEDLFQLGIDTVKERIEDLQNKRGRFEHYVGEE